MFGVPSALRVPSGKNSFDVIVEAEADKSFKVAGQRDADHVRGNFLDLFDGQRAAARFVTHAARAARIFDVNYRRCGRGGHRH